MNSKRIAIRVANISKCYRIGSKEKVHDSLGGAIFDWISSPLKNYRKYRSLYDFGDTDVTQDFPSDSDPHDIIWALRDVSLELEEGRVLGIIGKNGAGKSTLLKILSKITPPTRGRVEIRGRVSSLLEVGTGFHNELTGRENLYLNGTILGMTKKEIDRRFDEIVDFADVEKFIDTPIKRYSSGMKVRLAFSVAAHLEPEILLVDEVLAVGDATFQKKSLGKMKDVSRRGRTVLFISHNMAAISHLCERVIVLDSGKVQVDAAPSEAIAAYLRSLSDASENDELGLLPRASEMSPVIQKLEFFDGEGHLISAVNVGSPLTINIHYKHSESLRDPYFGLTFETVEGVQVFLVQTRLQKGHLPDLPSTGIVKCHIHPLTTCSRVLFYFTGLWLRKHSAGLCTMRMPAAGNRSRHIWNGSPNQSQKGIGDCRC
jgi:lipopolysaccharide transport system ATP-binding protein